MASLIRPISRRTQLLLSSKTLIQKLENPSPTLFPIENPISNSQTTIRTYVGEMRKSAFEGSVLRLLRNEIRFELDHSPPQQIAAKFGSFVVDERPGEQWIILKSKFGEKEELKIEVTMFDGSIPGPKSKGVPGEEDALLHITFIVNICKEGSGDVMEFLCSAWPDSVEIQKVFTHTRDQMPPHPYKGPEFKELDDELQKEMYEFLETRGINDELAAFMHKYMANKDKTEFVRWMEKVKSFVEQK